MDLIAVDPLLNMYDDQWPIRTYQPNLPPPKFIFSETSEEGRRGQAHDSIVCAGAILSGGRVERSIVGPDTRINSYADVRDSILFESIDIGRNSKIRRAIIDKGVAIPPETVIGYDLEHDRSRGFTVTESGITVIAKGEGVTHFAAPALG
jgi:glucose-1-phosphate adenylyltransferase